MARYINYSTLIRKQVFGNILSLAVDITFSILMFQILAIISLLKIKNFEPSYLCKTLNYTNNF